MRHAFFKLVFLAVVVGVGLVVVLQAQRGLNQPPAPEADNTTDVALGEAGDALSEPGQPAVPGQAEPRFGPETFLDGAEPVPASVKTSRTGGRTGSAAPSGRGRRGPAVARRDDPFGDSRDNISGYDTDPAMAGAAPVRRVQPRRGLDFREIEDLASAPATTDELDLGGLEPAAPPQPESRLAMNGPVDVVDLELPAPALDEAESAELPGAPDLNEFDPVPVAAPRQPRAGGMPVPGPGPSGRPGMRTPPPPAGPSPAPSGPPLFFAKPRSADVQPVSDEGTEDLFLDSGAQAADSADTAPPPEPKPARKLEEPDDEFDLGMDSEEAGLAPDPKSVPTAPAITSKPLEESLEESPDMAADAFLNEPRNDPLRRRSGMGQSGATPGLKPLPRGTSSAVAPPLPVLPGAAPALQSAPSNRDDAAFPGLDRSSSAPGPAATAPEAEADFPSFDANEEDLAPQPGRSAPEKAGDESLAPAPSLPEPSLPEPSLPEPSLPEPNLPAPPRVEPTVPESDPDDDASFTNGKPSLLPGTSTPPRATPSITAPPPAVAPLTPVAPIQPSLPSNLAPEPSALPAAAPRIEDDRDDAAQFGDQSRAAVAIAPATSGRGASGPANVQRPQLTIDKVAPASATLGQPMVYHIFVRNVGAVAAQQVVVEDVVPRHVQLKGTIPQAELAGTRLMWRIGALEPGAEKKISVRIVPTNEGVVSSVATVSFAAEANSQTLVTAPRIRFELLGPPQATVGAPVAFKFRVENIGREDAAGVVIRNVLPAGLRHSDGDDLEYEVGALAAGDSREVELTLTAAQVGRTVNRAVVTAEGGVSVEAEAPIEIRSASLDVKLASPRRMLLSRSSVFKSTISNSGSTPVSNVTIVQALPAGLEFVNASQDGRYDAQKRTVTWRLNRLAPRESTGVEVTLSANGRGSLVSVVRAFDAAGASGEAVATTVVAGVAALSIDVPEIPSLAEVGEQATFEMRVLNRGSEPAGNVRAVLVVPPGMEFRAVKGPISYRQNGDRIEFETIPKLDARSQVILQVTLQAKTPGDARIQMLVQGDRLTQPLRREEVIAVLNTGE